MRVGIRLTRRAAEEPPDKADDEQPNDLLKRFGVDPTTSPKRWVDGWGSSRITPPGVHRQTGRRSDEPPVLWRSVAGHSLCRARRPGRGRLTPNR
jgi:hypothetical protein